MSKQTTRPQLKSGFLTVYPTYAQVEAEYTVTLKQGDNTILLDGMPAKLVQKSVKVWELGAEGLPAPTLGLIEYSQPNLTPDQVQRRQLNEKVTVYYGGALPHEQQPISGILRYNQSNVALLEVDGAKIREVRNVQSIVFENGATNGLANTPSLSISVTAPEAGLYTLKLLYLAQGFKWEPEYIWTVDEDTRTFVLDGSVLITNQSGAKYPNTGLSVANGDAGVGAADDGGAQLESVSYSKGRSFNAADAEVQELGQCKFYNVAGTFTVSEAGAKAPLALISDIPFISDYRVGASAYWFQNSSEFQQTASRYLVVANTPEKIGRPLPGGKVKLLQVDKAGHPRQTGKGTLPDFAIGATAEVCTGEDIDLKVTRRVVDKTETEIERYQPKKKDDQLKRKVTYHYDVEVELFNGKATETTVRVQEQTDKKRLFLGNGHPFTQVLADQHEAKLTAPAHGKAKLRYRVNVTTIEVVRAPGAEEGWPE